MTGPKYRFALTATRLAAVMDLNDVGHPAHDLESGFIYMIKAAGTGAACFSNLTGRDLVPRNLALNLARKVSSGGDVGNIAAIGGLLASDTAPILRGDSAESVEISWATGVVDSVQWELDFPTSYQALDDTRDAYLDLDVYSGTTNAADFVVETSWNGGAMVADAAVATATATPHRVRVTIAAADIPTAVRRVTIAITPPTHATNAIQLVGATFSYWAA